jgi:MtaA/CmuA family methyltransferase
MSRTEIMTGRERVSALFAGQPVDRLPLMPITMMLAADHGGIPYRRYATDGRALAAAQLRIAEEYGFDHVSAISDPAREVSDLGGGVEWFDDQPPALQGDLALIDDKAKLKTLRVPDPNAPGRMSDRVLAVSELAAAAGERLMVEGWVEGPCAMAADLRGMNALMLDFFDDPAFVQELMQFSVAMELRFAEAQVRAGATTLGIGDAAASLIGPKLYRTFVQSWEKELIDGIHALGVPVRLHICGNTRRIAKEMGATGPDLIDFDSLSPLADARAAVGEAIALTANLDPVRALRDGTPESIGAALAECHAAAGVRFVVGAGCEVPRGTSAANLRALARYAHENR